MADQQVGRHPLDVELADFVESNVKMDNATSDPSEMVEPRKVIADSGTEVDEGPSARTAIADTSGQFDDAEMAGLACKSDCGSNKPNAEAMICGAIIPDLTGSRSQEQLKLDSQIREKEMESERLLKEIKNDPEFDYESKTQAEVVLREATYDKLRQAKDEQASRDRFPMSLRDKENLEYESKRTMKIIEGELQNIRKRERMTKLANKFPFQMDFVPNKDEIDDTSIAGRAARDKSMNDWVALQQQWENANIVDHYSEGKEWKITQVVGLYESRVAVIGRDEKTKTRVEIYQFGTRFKKLYEKIFQFKRVGCWQFGAIFGKEHLVLGCEQEVTLVSVVDNTLRTKDIGSDIKWGKKRIRAIAGCESGHQILLANDQDLVLDMFDKNLVHFHSIRISEPLDCVWSLFFYGHEVLVCGGIAGSAFSMNGQGRILYYLRPPESQQDSVPAVIFSDLDGFIRVLWLVKVEDGFRSVEFLYIPPGGVPLVEVRMDEKILHMTSMIVPDESLRTVGLTEKGGIYVAESLLSTVWNNSQDSCPVL